MTITAEEFDEALRKYAAEKFIPALTNPITRFALGAAIGSESLGLPMLGGIDSLRALNAVTEDGKVDLDALKKAVCAGFDATADGKLPIKRWGLGLSLDKGDAEALFAFMENTRPAPTEMAA